ncbi:MAG: hypothetical protein HN509_08805 [Halobacteriovoraceae bacterium]|jgi:geranylgeranyl pyrophosphate synthase|nr:hypothetical protein [Halobacteriovoraceae bacterium]MBT5095337.1 hypothetical protein [Halobacteriovoraceae bacterium]
MFELADYRNIIDQKLASCLGRSTPNHTVREIYNYSVLPSGKLFRPLLVGAIHHDLAANLGQESKLDSFVEGPVNLAVALELHHAYTLVHDDLPCMDDDDMRRGRPSTHKAFGQWQAVLVGDGLLNLSYQMLGQSESPHLKELLKLFAYATGPKGLIQGQVLDLSGEMSENWQNLIQTHQFKTARLIQLALVGGALCIDRDQIPNQLRVLKKLARLGSSLGVVFQLLDDLTEFCEEEVSQHEWQVNPWPRWPEKILPCLESELKKIQNVIAELELLSVKKVIDSYFLKTRESVSVGMPNIKKHLNGIGDLGPAMDLLQF